MYKFCSGLDKCECLNKYGINYIENRYKAFKDRLYIVLLPNIDNVLGIQ